MEQQFTGMYSEHNLPTGDQRVNYEYPGWLQFNQLGNAIRKAARVETIIQDDFDTGNKHVIVMIRGERVWTKTYTRREIMVGQFWKAQDQVKGAIQEAFYSVSDFFEDYLWRASVPDMLREYIHGELDRAFNDRLWSEKDVNNGVSETSGGRQEEVGSGESLIWRCW